MTSRAIIVTGANRGIGQGIAQALARRGDCGLVLHARNPDDAKAAAELALSTGAPHAIAVAGDLRDLTLGERLATATQSAFDGADGMVFNAAVLGPMKPLLDHDDTEFDDAMWLNVNAQFKLTKALLPTLSSRSKAALIYLTSGLGRFALPNFGVYTVSKHAIEGLAKQVAADYADGGIISCAVAPGMVGTRMLKAAMGTDDVSAHDSPDRVGEGFAALLDELLGADGAKHSGASLDIERWLPKR